MDILKLQMKGLSFEVGQGVAPALGKLIDSATDLLKWLHKPAPGSQDFRSRDHRVDWFYPARFLRCCQTDFCYSGADYRSDFARRNNRLCFRSLLFLLALRSQALVAIDRLLG